MNRFILLKDIGLRLNSCKGNAFNKLSYIKRDVSENIVLNKGT